MMKKKIFTPSWIVMISICLLLSSCASGVDQTNLPDQPQVLSATPNETMPPLQTMVTPSKEQLVTRTPTLTPTPSPERTMAPTLTKEQRKEFVVNALRNGKDCQLPCWWNVQPGHTYWSEAEELFHQLGSKTGSVPLGSNLILHGVGGFDFFKDAFNIYIDLLEKKGVVEGFELQVQRYGNPNAFHEAWQQYTPKKILEDYGIPDHIFIFVFDSHGLSDNGGITYYHLWLVYDRLGFFIKYTGQTKYGSVLHICPAFNQGEDINIIKIVMQSPDSKLAVEYRLDGSRDEESKGMKSLEVAAKLTSEDLYNRLIHNEKNGCFDTDLKVWQQQQ